MKTKEDHLNDLAKLAFKIDDVLQKQQERSKAKNEGIKHANKLYNEI